MFIGHIKRSNYVIYMNLHYDSSFINESLSNHDWIIQDSIYAPKRYHKPALLHTMISSLNKKKDHDNESDEEIVEEITDSICQDILNESDADETNTDKQLWEDDYTIKTYIFRFFYFRKLCILSRQLFVVFNFIYYPLFKIDFSLLHLSIKVIVFHTLCAFMVGWLLVKI